MTELGGSRFVIDPDIGPRDLARVATLMAWVDQFR